MVYKPGYMPEMESLLSDKICLLPTKRFFWFNKYALWHTNGILFQKQKRNAPTKLLYSLQNYSFGLTDRCDGIKTGLYSKNRNGMV